MKRKHVVSSCTRMMHVLAAALIVLFATQQAASAASPAAMQEDGSLPADGPMVVASLVNEDAERQSEAEYQRWLDRELAHLVVCLDGLGLEPGSLLVELANPPGGHCLSGEERGHMRMFRERAWRDAYYRALRRISTALRGREELWGLSLLSEPATSRTPAGRAAWRDTAAQAGQLVNLWLPGARVVVEPVDGLVAELEAEGFFPVEGVQRLVYGVVPGERLLRAVQVQLDAGREPLRAFEFGQLFDAAASARDRSGCQVILTGQRALAPDSAAEGATALRSRMWSGHGIAAPFEVLAGTPLNHERGAALLPVDRPSLRNSEVMRAERPEWSGLLRAPRRVLPQPVEPELSPDTALATHRRASTTGAEAEGAGGSGEPGADFRRADPWYTGQDSDALAARDFALAAFRAHPGLTRSPSTLLVRWRAGDPQTYRHAVRALVGDGAHLELAPELDIEMIALRVPPHVAAERLAPFVEDVDPDLKVVLASPQAPGQVLPSDPLFASQYPLHATGSVVQGDGLQWHDVLPDADINAPQAWALQTGSQDVRIAVIDTGIHDHFDFYDVDPASGGKLVSASNLWTNPDEIAGDGIDNDGNGYVDDLRGWNFVPDAQHPAGDPYSADAHGTKVAGIVGARGNSGRGLAGVAWRCKIVPVKAFLSDAALSTTSSAITALEYCRSTRIEIVNCSWHTVGAPPSQVDTLRATLVAMQATPAPGGTTVRGQLVVAAAGNTRTDLDALPSDTSTQTFGIYPACFSDLPNVVTVAASDFSDQNWDEDLPLAPPSGWTRSGSNYGATKVQLYAPGRGVWGLAPGVSGIDPNQGLYSPAMDGTSFAAPHVAGAAALLWSSFPTLTSAEVRARILSSVRVVPQSNLIYARCSTHGILDVAAALRGTADQLPVVAILEPQNDAGSDRVVRTLGEPIAFLMSAVDPVDGPVLPAYTWWTSNLHGGQLASGSTTFATATLVPGTHIVTASAVDAAGSGRVASAQRTVQIVLAPAPAAPTNLSITSGGTNIANLSWTDNAGNETSFEIQRQRSVGNGQWSNTTPFWADEDATGYSDSHANFTYRYRVRARNGGATSAWTGWVVAP